MEEQPVPALNQVVPAPAPEVPAANPPNDEPQVEGEFEKEEKVAEQQDQSQSKLSKSKEVMRNVMVNDYASKQVTGRGTNL